MVVSHFLPRLDKIQQKWAFPILTNIGSSKINIIPELCIEIDANVSVDAPQLAHVGIHSLFNPIHQICCASVSYIGHQDRSKCRLTVSSIQNATPWAWASSSTVFSLIPSILLHRCAILVLREFTVPPFLWTTTIQHRPPRRSGQICTRQHPTLAPRNSGQLH